MKCHEGESSVPEDECIIDVYSGEVHVYGERRPQ